MPQQTNGKENVAFTERKREIGPGPEPEPEAGRESFSL